MAERPRPLPEIRVSAPCGTITIKRDSFFFFFLGWLVYQSENPVDKNQKPERNEAASKPYCKRLDLIVGLEIFATKSRAITHAAGARGRAGRGWPGLGMKLRKQSTTTRKRNKIIIVGSTQSSAVSQHST